MIELQTNPDFLHTLAADNRAAGREETAKGLDSAAHDIKNVRDYAEQLERSVNQMSGEIVSHRTQRDEAAAALLSLIRPELEKMVDQMMEHSGPMEDLHKRVELLENDDDEAATIRTEVRDMIADGEIIVSIDYM